MLGRDGVQPFPFPVGALLLGGPLLVQGEPQSGIAPRLGDLALGEPLRPQALSDGPVEGIVSVLADHGQADDVPGVALLLEDAAGEVVLVPSGHDEHLHGVRLEPGPVVEAIPVPELLPLGFRGDLLSSSHRIVDEAQVGSKARYGRSGAGGHVLPG